GPAGASQAAGPAGTAETAKTAETAETAETAGAAAAPSPSRRRVRLRMSLVLPEPEGPDVAYADPELLEAARWFGDSNPLPQLSGFAARKAKVSYRCENPECWRRSLLHPAHHRHWVQHGGTDDPDNAVGL